MFDSIIHHYFSGLGVALSKSFTRYVSGAVSACSFSTHEIARHVSKATEMSFNTSEKGLSYLLSNDNFQIDDHYWRMHTGMIFGLMREQKLLRQDEQVYLQVDFTSNKDHFLILSASIIINNRSVPVYFTMRNYPKKKDQYDHKKMEEAFIRGLKHVLSKKYQYVIVADRGFGNPRFMALCEENGFGYVLRCKGSVRAKSGENEGPMEEICSSDGKYPIRLSHSQKETTLYRCSNASGAWFLVSNISDMSLDDAGAMYKNRFKIEKCFQDLKSSGFDMEASKIRKYSNYKRLLAICMVAHALLVLLGHFIVVKIPDFLKNSAGMAAATLASFQSEKKQCSYFQKHASQG